MTNYLMYKNQPEFVDADYVSPMLPLDYSSLHQDLLQTCGDDVTPPVQLSYTMTRAELTHKLLCLETRLDIMEAWIVRHIGGATSSGVGN